jgi:membrane protease YdiL (CAAX protease family)
MLRSVLAAVVIGLLFFGAVMGATLGLIVLNTRTSPDFAWFPLPATLLIVAAMWGAERRWHIGLRNTTHMPVGRAYGIGLGLTVLGVAACALQGYFSGYERATELLDADVDRTFQRTYAIYMAVFAAVLAEVTFRGIVQVRMQRVLGGWPVVMIIGLVNVLAHRWGPEITHNGIGLFVVLAGWTYLRWVSKSLWPPLVMHAATNLIVGLWLWHRGSIVHADMSPAGATVVAIAGLLGLLLSMRLIRGVEPKHQV